MKGYYHGWGRWRPFDVDDNAPIVIRGALDVRDFRDQVRFTTSLASSHRPVFEEMSDSWAANYATRTIYWRMTMSFPPHTPLSPREILFFIMHEAGHLDFTGGYEVPDDWKPAKRDAFHSFFNAVEDIRIERLQGREFGGFDRIRKVCNRKWLGFHAGSDSWDYAIWDQVGLGWIWHENEETRPNEIGNDGCREFAEALWPDLSRIANAATSNKVVQALIPIFEMLWEEQEREEKENRQNGRQQGDFGSGMTGDKADPFKGCGDGFPEEPNKETWDEFPELRDHMGKEDQLQQIGRNARGAGKVKLEQAERDEKKQRQAAEDQRVQVEATNKEGPSGTGEGGGIGRDDDHNPRPPADHWARTRTRLDPQIRALSHRLRSTLRTNMMSDWSEGLRRGKLNTRRARRAVAGNPRIFRKRHEIGAHDYTFGIVDDCSGSMGKEVGEGRKVKDHVLDMTVLLAEAFEKAGMNSFIVSHEHQMRSAKHVREHLGPVAEQLGSDIAYSGGGTYEAPALIVAQEEFRKVRSGHKVLFVLSDGQTSRKEDSIRLVRELQQEGVRIIGVGLRIDPPQHHPVRVRVDDVRQLPSLLPRMINDIVRKGAK